MTRADNPQPNGQEGMRRTPVYTPELADAICARLAAGESLLGICRDEGMPAEATVRRWALVDMDGFAAKYTQAREDQAHAIAEQAVEEAVKAEDPQLGRLAFDARRWFAGKVAPRIYGERINVDATVKRDPSELTDAELAAIAAGRSGTTAAKADGAA